MLVRGPSFGFQHFMDQNTGKDCTVNLRRLKYGAAKSASVAVVSANIENSSTRSFPGLSESEWGFPKGVESDSRCWLEREASIA